MGGHPPTPHRGSLFSEVGWAESGLRAGAGGTGGTGGGAWQQAGGWARCSDSIASLVCSRWAAPGC